MCAAKDRRHPDKYCIDCGIKINYRSTRCKTCYDILQDKGKSKERTKFNNSPEWKNARRSVYERDNYTCVVCNRTGGKLECHHVIRYADDKSKRLDVNNLITVCYDCHKYIHFGDHIGA